jgi:hypothetical protein
MIPKDGTKPEDMLRPEYLAAYKAQLLEIWNRLIWLRESMHVVNSISHYPLRRFIDDPQEVVIFWNLIVSDCGDAVVLKLHSLVNDTSATNLGLHRLKQSVRRWLRPEFLTWYEGRLHDARFDPELRSIAERIDRLRDKHIAHSEWQPDATSAAGPRPSISAAEVEQLYQGIEKLFQACCLTDNYIIDMNEAQRGGPMPRTSDRLLDLVARHSRYVNEPEICGESWSSIRESLSAEELEERNKWRRKFDLPPA